MIRLAYCGFVIWRTTYSPQCCYGAALKVESFRLFYWWLKFFIDFDLISIFFFHTVNPRFCQLLSVWRGKKSKRTYNMFTKTYNCFCRISFAQLCESEELHEPCEIWRVQKKNCKNSTLYCSMFVLVFTQTLFQWHTSIYWMQLHKLFDS